MAQDTFDDALRVRTDEMKQIITHRYSPNITFEGRSYLGALTSAAVWQIKRIVKSGDITKIDFAANGLYTQVWDNRLAAGTFTTTLFDNSKSLILDGVNDYLQVPNNSRIDFTNTQAFSWSLWIKTTDASAKTLLYKRTTVANSPGYSITKTAGGELVFILRQNAGSFIQVTTTGAAIAAGTWKHVVVTYTGSSLASGVAIYVNNVSLALTVNTNTLAGSIANTADLYFGATNPGTSANIAANLDEISLWTKALSTQEISDIYNSGKPADLSLHSAVMSINVWLRCGDGDEYPIIKDQADISDATMVNMTVYDMSGDVP